MCHLTCVIMKSFPLRYRPGPDDIRGSALARGGSVFLLCPLSAASSRPSLPPSSGAHLLLQVLLARWRPQQLWLLWFCAAEQTASAKTLREHRETPAATVWFSAAATRGRQTPYNSCKRLHPCCSGGQRWSQYIGVILRWYVGHSGNKCPWERLFSHIYLLCFFQVSTALLQFKTDFLHPVVILTQEAPTHLFPTFI